MQCAPTRGRVNTKFAPTCEMYGLKGVVGFLSSLLMLSMGCFNVDDSETVSLDFLKLNDRPCAIDYDAGLILFPLPDEYYESHDFSPRINYSCTEDLRLIIDEIVIEDGEIAHFRTIAINDTIPVQMASGSHSEPFLFIFTGLPVVQISSVGIMDAIKIPGSFLLTAPNEPDDVSASLIGIEQRGSLALNYDKKPFSVEFRENDNWSEKADKKLLGMREDDDWILEAAYLDASLMKNRVSHDLFLDLWEVPYDDRGKSTIEGRFVELLLNGRYEGVYVLSERVDRKLLKLGKIGGALFKAVDIRYEDTRRWFELKYPDSYDTPAISEAWENLDSFVDIIKYGNDYDFYESIDNFADMNNIVNYHILLLVTSALDNDRKNHYLARDTDDKYFFVPWDLDYTFGYTGGWRDNYLTIRLMDDERYRNLLKNRWNELRADLLNEGILMNRFTTYYTLLLETGAYQRNRERWPLINNYEFAFSYLEDRIPRRLAWLDATIGSL